MKVEWTICAAASVVIAGLLNSRSMDVSSRLLAVIIIVETLVLLIFDVSVVASQGWAAFTLRVLATELCGSALLTENERAPRVISGRALF